MGKSEIDHTQILPPPNWSQVRAIYRKLCDEFHVLTSAFGVTVDLQTKINLELPMEQ